MGIGRDEDIAKVVAFLASDEGGFVAGSEIFVDGVFVQNLKEVKHEADTDRIIGKGWKQWLSRANHAT